MDRNVNIVSNQFDELLQLGNLSHFYQKYIADTQCLPPHQVKSSITLCANTPSDNVFTFRVATKAISVFLDSCSLGMLEKTPPKLLRLPLRFLIGSHIALL